MGHIDVNRVSHTLPDGRVLLDEVSFRVGEGSVTALIGANGAGKSTLLRIVRGAERPQSGAVTLDGALAVMDQFVGHVRDETTVHELLVSVSPPAVREAHADLEAAEAAMMVDDGEKTQMRYAGAIARYGDAGGYEAEVVWDQCCTAALGVPYERCRWREVRTLSGGEQKRLVLESLLRGPAPLLLLDEPDNYLDVPGKRWLEEALLATPKTVLLVSHDRELLSRVPDRIVTLELGAAGNTAWTHAGAFGTYHEARRERFARLDELRRRWDEEHAKLKALVSMYKQKAAYNSDMASRYQSAQTRLRRFEEAGPPEKLPRDQSLRMRLRGGRTGKRALVCAGLELTGLMRPFDLEVHYGERVAVLGSNGSGKSHFLRLLAGGGSDPEGTPLSEEERARGAPVPHEGRARLGARVLPGWFAQTHEHPEFAGRTLLDILHRGEGSRKGVPRDEAGRALDRYELARAAEQTFDTLSGGQQARFQILLLELSGATMLLLDEPTDNLDVVSAEALEAALDAYEGTILAVTHDRWFARGFDRFLVFGADGNVYESDEPVWDEGRVQRAR
ncbi:ATP-binding cassette domain-containing protein [Nocardiopsis changdeensis]|uniref:ABC-F family ATP-binding cassette domain-containing protein n=1 Tax=Nocardiopsis changdeensis TaxID=2831969 RepID=A0ABX8BVQ5_9ACTN|nr:MULTISPECIES: ATP-binding cassette domain-containing protein [Nocardiopsis]QUX24891.1 ABC-F family ATP-binding cassette domain-containing protein [Nocardiopsis changdeensis]QYX35277.1 ATP-binding cassette domain-containing protein [Nocardiopsis sp. MT53]